MSTNILLRI
jgi:hypothetical protein